MWDRLELYSTIRSFLGNFFSRPLQEMKKLGHRESMILSGLFLSKFDKDGLDYLGFTSFSEAYNGMGYALGGKPASIKNYMQEFDPVFPNTRVGRHGRPMRDHCRVIMERFGKLPMEQFAATLRPILEQTNLPEGMDEFLEFDEGNLENSTFSKRLVTGIAAESFFATKFPSLTQFIGHTLDNVTRFGCGFDFRIQPETTTPFLAAEVKGLAAASGSIMMTEKEHRVAKHLGDRYFLCLVSNFSERPTLSIFQNPVNCGLEFSRQRKSQTVTSWHTRISA